MVVDRPGTLVSHDAGVTKMGILKHSKGSGMLRLSSRRVIGLIATGDADIVSNTSICLVSMARIDLVLTAAILGGSAASICP